MVVVAAAAVVCSMSHVLVCQSRICNHVHELDWCLYDAVTLQSQHKLGSWDVGEWSGLGLQDRSILSNQIHETLGREKNEKVRTPLDPSMPHNIRTDDNSTLYW